MDGWQPISIGDLCDAGEAELQTGPFGSQLHAHEYVAAGVPIVPTEAIRERRIDHSVLPKIMEAKAKDLSRHSLRPGDILFARRGVQATGHSAFVRNHEAGFICGTGAIRLRLLPPNRRVNPAYLSHVIANPKSIEWFKFHAIGATMPNLNESIIRSFVFACPSLGEQRAIASILGALDDKIELNQRMNETLEAMARAIFQDWFVTFGPTRAKMEGRPPYLAPDLWSLFPNRLDAEGKPEGWCASTIGEEVTVVGGTTPSTKEPAFWNGDLHWATPKDLSTLAVPVLLDTERRITAKGLSQIGSGLLPVGSVLLSSRAPIGYLAVNLVPTAINQGFIGMVCERRLSNMFVWLWTKANMEVILQKANGSTFQEISKSNFRPIPVVVPGKVALGAFEAAVRPIWDRLCANVREQGSLAATRDLLLPRLMSGELRVKDAERAIETAA
jgi:type I restriction enzyme S subunit